MDIGERLRELRLAKAISRTRLEACIGMPPSRIAVFEVGTENGTG
jgi:transcriptional regulator with XRE-family HTH domain